jgi:hypothetical protein
MNEEPINLLTFQPTLSGQDFRLRKLGLAASAVFTALKRQGEAFRQLVADLGESQLTELLGKDGAANAVTISADFAKAISNLESIYPTPTTGEGSGDATASSTGSDAGAGQSSAADPSPPTTTPPGDPKDIGAVGHPPAEEPKKAAGKKKK